MTEKQIEKMKKYAELIKFASYVSGCFASEHIEKDSADDRYGELRTMRIADYLILRMEREMKR